MCVDKFHEEEVVLRALVKGEIWKSSTSPTPPQKKGAVVLSTAVKNPLQQVPRLLNRGKSPSVRRGVYSGSMPPVNTSPPCA